MYLLIFLFTLFFIVNQLTELNIFNNNYNFKDYFRWGEEGLGGRRCEGFDGWEILRITFKTL